MVRSRSVAVIIDLAFPLRGEPLPADHGFALYGAVSAVESLHGRSDYGIHPVRGRPLPERRLALTARSQLTIRTDHTQAPLFLPLAGRSLRVGEAGVTAGVPTTRPLRPSPAIESRLVIIKGLLDPALFLEAATRQLDTLGISGRATLVERPAGRRVENLTPPAVGPIRRTLRIHGREVVGFAVRVTQLNPEDSLRLQAVGLGGRRRFGCGIFVPVMVR